MNKVQWLAAGFSVLLVFFLYFAFDIIPKEKKELEKSRSLQVESTGIDNMERQALGELEASQQQYLRAMAGNVENAGDTLAKIQALKDLSGAWYDAGYAGIAGHYAEETAQLDKSAGAWAIAGTTYAICYQQSKEEKTILFCWKRAVAAFEAAVSVDPKSVDARINLAICYIDRPPADNPMQGILMLRSLNDQFPGNTKVLNQLARLALQTGQTEKALERLGESIQADPENGETACLMVEALEQKGDMRKADEFRKKCVH